MQVRFPRVIAVIEGADRDLGELAFVPPLNAELWVDGSLYAPVRIQTEIDDEKFVVRLDLIAAE